MTDYADRVAFLRRLANVSRAELAEAAGLSVAVVGHWERRDRRHPDGSALLKLAKATGADVEWLLNGLGEPPTARAVRRAIAATRRAA